MKKPNRIAPNNNKVWSPGGKSIDDCYKDLATEIVICACEDYVGALMKDLNLSFMTADEASAVRFLNSPMPEYYTGIPAEVIRDKLAKRVEEMKREQEEGNKS